MNVIREWWKGKFPYPLVVTLTIIIGVGLVVLLISLGYHADWTGFNRHVESVPAGQQDQPAKTLWDWMSLLIVPTVLVVGAFLFNLATSKTEQKIALDKQREDLLQIYLDRMSELLLKESLRTSQADAEVRNVARVRTLTALGQLDTSRQSAVLAFLRESKLVTSELGKSIVSLGQAQMSHAYLRRVNFSYVDLGGADLSFADLSFANLIGAILIEAHFRKANLIFADLIGADLRGAHLIEADLIGADLSGARLIRADLSCANLYRAHLSGADLSCANLNGAHLSKTDLSCADLSGADLSGADLKWANLNNAILIRTILTKAKLDGADLRGANVTDEQLSLAESLKGTTMPDGTKHP